MFLAFSQIMAQREGKSMSQSKRKKACGLCKETGHQTRTCPKAKGAGK